MLKHRALGFALRDAFPDVLAGIYSPDETPGIERDVTPQPSAPVISGDTATAVEAVIAPEAADPEQPPAPALVERKELLAAITLDIETKNPDGLPYFDVHAVDRWRERIREAGLRGIAGWVHDCLEKLVKEYKPVPFEAKPATGTGANAAALAMYNSKEPEPEVAAEVDPEAAAIRG